MYKAVKFCANTNNSVIQQFNDYCEKHHIDPIDIVGCNISNDFIIMNMVYYDHNAIEGQHPEDVLYDKNHTLMQEVIRKIQRNSNSLYIECTQKHGDLPDTEFVPDYLVREIFQLLLKWKK